MVFADEQRAGELTRFNMLRQQEAIADSKANLSLADFVADPQGAGARLHRCVCGHRRHRCRSARARLRTRKRRHNAILVKALADRLAEAAAAYLHARSREEWGIAESASADDILHERHRGIRPGFGYPACPDHSGSSSCSSC